VEIFLAASLPVAAKQPILTFLKAIRVSLVQEVGLQRQ
jgi:amidase